MTAVLDRVDASEVEAEVRAMTSGELAALHGTVLEPVATREERRRKARSRRLANPVAQEWRDMAWAQYEAAEAATHGYMLSPAGKAAGIDPWALWSGPWARAERLASWELLRWFEANPRLTITQYREQARRQEETYRDEHDRDEHDRDQLADDDAGDVRHGSEASADGTVRGTGPVRDTGHVRGPAVRASCKHPGRDGAALCGDCPRRQVVRLTEPGQTVLLGEVMSGYTPADRLRMRAQMVREETGARGSLPVPVSDPGPSDTPGTGWYARQAASAAHAAAQRAPKAPADVAVRDSGTVTERRPRQEIDGDQVLRYLFTFLKRFAVWGSDAEIVTVALWIAMTHARDGNAMPIWDYCARLGILGPSGSGKSWKSRLVGKLSSNGEILCEPTKPAFIDSCAENATIIITEADEQFRSPGRSRGILAVINASYEPDRFTSRKQGGVAVKIPLYCHIVLDGIDDVLLSANRPDLRAMMSRCIIVPARKAPDGYRPPSFDRSARAMAELLGQRCAAWMGQEVAAGMADDLPAVPEHLGNRPFALWAPLFTVAARADRYVALRDGTDPDRPGEWSQACAEACEILEAGTTVMDEEEELSELDRMMAEWGEAS